MPDEHDLGPVIAGLKSGLETGDLSTAAQRQGRQILDRLQSRVRVVLLGPAGVGKTQLRRVLLGLDGPDGPALVFSRQSHIALDIPDLETVQADMPCLRDIDVIDCESPDTGATGLAPLLAVADVVLWCSENFDGPEADFWAGVPDHLKDHSFLVLTKADTLAARSVLQDCIEHMAQIASEEFHSFFPTTTAAALAELRKTRAISPATFGASGCKALADAVCKLAADGRQADLDAALMFMTRNGIELDHSAPVAPEVRQRQPVTRTYEKALDLMRRRMADLHLAEGDALDPVVPEILELCASVSDDLVDLVSTDTEDDEAYEAWRDDIYAAADKITLMGMEETTAAAADAVGILAQISRELTAQLVH